MRISSDGVGSNGCGTGYAEVSDCGRSRWELVVIEVWSKIGRCPWSKDDREKIPSGALFVAAVVGHRVGLNLGGNLNESWFLRAC